MDQKASTTYTDAKNRKFTVIISTAALKRMRSMANFTLDSIFSISDDNDAEKKKIMERYQAFLDDDIRVSEVLYAVLKPDCDAANISQDQFDEGLQGEANAAAIMALHQAITDFSPPRRKQFLRGVKMALAKLEKAANAYGRRMDKEAEKLTDEKIEEIVNADADARLKSIASGSAAISA